MSFQIVYQASDRQIIGIGPFDPGTDFGPDYPITTIDDDQELNFLLATDPAYLCADGQTIGGGAC